MKRLVILAPNWLGDAVMALPAIADVRRGAPETAITVAARAAVAPLFQLVPGITETIVLPKPPAIHNLGRWATVGAALAGRAFDAALLFPNSMHTALLASRAGIPERWGFRTSWRGGLLTRAIPRTPGLHQIASYQQLVERLGFPNLTAAPRIDVPPAAREAAAQLLAAEGWDGHSPLVALAPGAAYGGAKRWPPAYFAELVTALAADEVGCVMIGSAADAATGDEIVRAIAGARGRGVINVIGRTDLPMLAGVLTLCRTLVTNDSGAMHLAAAAGVGVTAVFGPTDETATRPIGGAHDVLTHPVWCRPCMLRECPLDHQCMRGVAVGDVLASARRHL